MGTVREWVHVALVSVFWAGAMLLLECTRRESKFKPGRSGPGILAFALGGLLFGVLITFGWRAFRVPLIFLTTGLLITTWICGRLFRRDAPAKTLNDANPSGAS